MIKRHIPVQLSVTDSWPLAHPDPHKIRVSRSKTVAEVMGMIRERCIKDLQPHQAVFMFFPDNTLAPQSELISDLYNKFVAESDGVLHVTLQCESAFGGPTQERTLTDRGLQAH